MPYMLRYDLPPTERDQQQEETHADQGGPVPSDRTKPPQPIKTIYVTMSTTDPQRHVRWQDIGNSIMACLAIALLLTFAFVPDAPAYTTKTLTVPAILLPVQTIAVSVPITATGVKSYSATNASGRLTITNGGSLTEYIQAGFLLTAGSGVEVATDQGVTVLAGNGESYGMATVAAHAVAAGSSGNIPAYGINRTYGTDVFIKNLSAFTGGKVEALREANEPAGRQCQCDADLPADHLPCTHWPANRERPGERHEHGADLQDTAGCRYIGSVGRGATRYMFHNSSI